MVGITVALAVGAALLSTFSPIHEEQIYPDLMVPRTLAGFAPASRARPLMSNVRPHGRLRFEVQRLQTTSNMNL